MYAFSHIFASFVAAIVTNFTSKIDGHDSWRIPVGLILIFPSLVLATVWMIPESPRWLLRQGRLQEAVDSIYYLRGARKDYPAEEEARLIMETIETAQSKGRWSELFRGINGVRAPSFSYWDSEADNRDSAVPGSAFWQRRRHKSLDRPLPATSKPPLPPVSFRAP